MVNTHLYECCNFNGMLQIKDIICPNKEYIQKIILDKQTELQQRMLEFNSEQKEYTTTTLLNDENKRFELKTVCQFYQEQIEQCKVLCK